MKPGRIVILTGCPGTGKTTVASQIAKESALERSVHMHTDDFYHFLAKGAIAPHLPQSNDQNGVVIEAFLAAAERFVRGGYDVIVDGVVGPWFLAPFLQAAQAGIEVHYIVLRASLEETLRRAIAREKPGVNAEVAEAMWPQFAQLGPYEKHVVDTTQRNVAQTVQVIQADLMKNMFLLKGE